MLTAHEFGDLVRKLPEIRTATQEVAQLAQTNPDRVKAFFGTCTSWAPVYELDFQKQIAYLITLLGMHGPFIEAAKTANPCKALLNITEDGAELDQWYETHKTTLNKTHFLWLLMVLQRNVVSIMFHHQSLGGLVDEVRRGNDEAFFKAVMVDRSILSCPTFGNRLAQAEFCGDKSFFIRVRRAIKGPSQKHMATIGDIRYGIVVLREAGFDSFTDDQLISFFVNNRLYPNHYNAAKNLRKHIQVAKKFSRT